MGASPFNKYRQLNPVGPVQFQPYGTGNLPGFTYPGTLQSQPMTVGDATSSGNWLTKARRFGNLQNQSIFNQRKLGVGRNLARMGLQFSSPKWEESLLNPAYEQLYRSSQGLEAQLAQLEREDYWKKKWYELQKQMAEVRPDWLNFAANLGGAALGNIGDIFGLFKKGGGGGVV